MSSIGLQFIQRTALVLAVAFMVACSWFAAIDSTATAQIDAGLKRTLISFATARSINALISVAQGTQIAIEPGGIGVNLALGQVLDPINDLVEKFSNLALVASIAFGIEKVLISIGANWQVSLSLTIVATTWGYIFLRRKTSPRWLSQILMVLLMIRFVMPVVFIGSGMLFQKFMEADYQTSLRAVETVSGQLDKLSVTSATAPEGQGFLDRIKGWASQQTNDFKARLISLKQSVEQVINHIIKLMVIFVLQALLLPVLLLWILWGLVKGLFEAPSKAFRLAGQQKSDDS